MSKRDGKMRLKAGERLSLVRSHGHQDLGITESVTGISIARRQ